MRTDLDGRARSSPRGTWAVWTRKSPLGRGPRNARPGFLVVRRHASRAVPAPVGIAIVIEGVRRWRAGTSGLSVFDAMLPAAGGRDAGGASMSTASWCVARARTARRTLPRTLPGATHVAGSRSERSSAAAIRVEYGH